MNRRDFLSAGAAGLAATAASTTTLSASGRLPASGRPGHGRFSLNYAPHFGTFKYHAGDDLIDQLRFMADQGFHAVEDNGLKRRPLVVRRQIRREMERRGMTMGLFVGTADYGTPTFASGRNDLRQQVLADIREAVDVAGQMNAGWFTVVPGTFDDRLPIHAQTAHAVETLKGCAAICESAGVVMLLEPLNHWGSQPRLFLHSVSQAVHICRQVDSPACRILLDIYHQQVLTKDPLSLIAAAWDWIAYYQIGDDPGRKEPGTGRIDYHSLFGYLRGRGFRGLLGMDHGNSLPGRAGEQALIDAYLAHDHFRS